MPPQIISAHRKNHFYPKMRTGKALSGQQANPSKLFYFRKIR